MAQPDVCDTSFTPTVEMRARYEQWIAEAAAEAGVDVARLTPGRTEWMHPLDMIAHRAVYAETPDAPLDESLDALRTAVGIGREGILRWTARSTGVSPDTIKTYDPERTRYDIHGPTALYRYFDHEDRLLYVGVARDPEKRDREHEQTSSWFGYADRREIRWYPNRATALADERAAIRAELPVFNTHGARVAPDEPEEYVMMRNLDLIAEAVTR